MYIEQLTLPKEHELPLWETVAGLQEPDVIVRAQGVCELVRASVKPLADKPIGSVDLDDKAVAASQSSNCYGSTLVLSEALDLADIPHYVAWANGHAFTLVTDSDASRVHLFDAYTPKFNADLSHVVTPNILSLANDQIEQSGRAVIRLHSEDLVRHAQSANESIEELMRKHDWLSHGASYDTNDRRFTEPEQITWENTLFTSLYAPAIGRQVLRNHNALYQAQNSADYRTAADLLRRLRGLYPELDHRNVADHERLGKMALYFAAIEEPEKAHQVIDDVETSFNARPDLNLSLWPAHTLRRIGQFILECAKFDQLDQEDYRASLELAAQYLNESIAKYEPIVSARPGNREIAKRYRLAITAHNTCQNGLQSGIIGAKLPETVAAITA